MERELGLNKGLRSAMGEITCPDCQGVWPNDFIICPKCGIGLTAEAKVARGKAIAKRLKDENESIKLELKKKEKEMKVEMEENRKLRSDFESLRNVLTEKGIL